ncbi:hypothetical protein [Vibrio aestuarianus]|uniref:Tse2 family ADP-ribosyltransferase toxin n=1 Tax=Vibrio aestuarianus TaxID=28171 RepID=UPI001593CD4D|nr:hypothetical protein [Vibrio aestuarianus]MDE1236836.1 hypothetical protein [Vibrio aestuarianus]MDE1247772.1 hypothetical protein [Vibrio aestuarianus]NGZ64905.1 hypothetical protein [Vibrio aestuarianus subsp. cardii]
MKQTLKLYRDMQIDEDGYPKLGLNSKRLGVRIVGFNKVDGEPADTKMDENGDVHPGKGMSVTPPDVRVNVKDFAVERINDGKTVMWEIDEAVLAPLNLKFVQDSDDHGCIEPAHKMPAQRYAMLIEGTKKLWRVSNDL